MRTTVFICTLILLVSPLITFPQCRELKLPQDPDKRAEVEEKRAVYEDYIRDHKYKEAIASHQWLLTNSPDLQLSIYINGEKIYSNLAKAAETPTDRRRYADSLMVIYDMRMQYCPDPKVLDRKATSALMFYQKDKDKLEWVLSLYDQNLSNNSAIIRPSNLKNHMLVMKLNKAYLKNLTSEEIISRYNSISEVIDSRNDELGSIREDIDDLFIDLVGKEFGCEETRKYLVPKFTESPEDIQLARNIFQFMLRDKCTDDPVWLKAAEAIYAPSPTPGLAKIIGQKHIGVGNPELAFQYFNQALELDTVPENKAEVYLLLGNLAAKEGKKEEARNYYKKALKEVPDFKDAYNALGNLYFGAFNNCAKRVSKVDDRLVFIAAYEMYQKAGNTKQMKTAKEQFPSKEEIFIETVNPGDKVAVGCFIKETVTIRTRD